MQTYNLTVLKPGRLDKVIAILLPEVSRSAAQRLIQQGLVTVNGVARASGHAVRSGDVLLVRVPDAAPTVAQPEQIPLAILYEDADVLAIDKPAGMVVHPGAGNATGTLANAVLAHTPSIAGVGDARRPGVVHRLDKETSGVVLVAKTEMAYRALQAQFKSRIVKKHYLALCVGLVQPPRGIIDKPIGRDPSHRQRMAVVIGGRQAVTPYQVTEVYRIEVDRLVRIQGADADAEPQAVMLRTGSVYSLVRARPATGRTHQLRVHFASLGFPIAGDALYGATRRDVLSRALAPRHLLHASELSFEQPSSGKAVHLYAPMPADMRRVIDSLEGVNSE